jgi:hypothetical protein
VEVLVVRLMLASMACLFLAAGTAKSATQVAWAFANQPDATTRYAPPASHRYSSDGGAINIVPLATGSYRVDFAGFYSGTATNSQVNGDVQVSAVRTSGYCTANKLTAHKTTIQAYVTCFDVNGNPANSRFTILFQFRDSTFGDSGDGLGYLWANAAGGGYNPYYQYNSTGAGNQITNYDGAGTFTAFLPGLTSFGGDVQAVAYDYNGPTRCKADGWGSDSSGTTIKVLCLDVSGKPAYAIFYLTYALNEPFGSIPGTATRGAYAWVDEPGSTSVYTPDTDYQYNGFGTGSLTAQKTGVGRYTATIPGTISYKSSIALVTAYTYLGDSYPHTAYCNIAGWTIQTINVACYKQGGARTDAYFDVAFQTAG